MNLTFDNFSRMIIIKDAVDCGIFIPELEQAFFNAHFDLMAEDLKETNTTELWNNAKPFEL